MVRKSVTLKDVAQEVGVSINLVSCVINPRKPGNVKVSPATRTAILKAARRLGYLRNTAAARLVGCSTRTLGILMSNLTNPMTAPIVDAFEEQAVQMGYQCFIGCTRFDSLRKLEFVEQMLSHGVEGLLLTTVWNDPEVEHALRIAVDTNMPVVFIDYMWEARPSPLICGNHFMGGQLLARHLFEMGHRRLAFLCDEAQRNLRSIRERIRGIQSVMEENGADPAELGLLWSSQHRSASFTETVLKRLREPDAPSAVLCSGDLTAIELLVGLHSHGVHVPRDLAITGYDDLLTPFIQANLHLDNEPLPWRLPLTTVRQPMAEIGRRAASVLISQIEEGKRSNEEHHLLDVELITGESSRLPER